MVKIGPMSLLCDIFFTNELNKRLSIAACSSGTMMNKKKFTDFCHNA